jgi:hypothetical protein
VVDDESLLVDTTTEPETPKDNSLLHQSIEALDNSTTWTTIVPPTEVTPAGTTASSKRGPADEDASPPREGGLKFAKFKTSLQDDVYMFRCRSCDKSGCPYGNGRTIFSNPADCDGPHPEFDPTGETLLLHHLQSSINKPRLGKTVSVVRQIVAGILKSTGIWPNNKYIGDPRLDSNLRHWAGNKVSGGAALVEATWFQIRHAAKETLDVKRQRCVLLIRDAFFRELLLVFCLLFVPIW